MNESAPPAENLYVKPQAPVAVSTPANIQALREADPHSQALQKLYPNTVEPAAAAWMRELPGPIPAEQRLASAKEWTQICRDVGLSDHDLADMLARSRTTKSLSDEQIGQNQAQALRALESEYGARASAVYADALKLMDRDQRTGQMLRKTNLREDPETVKLFARKAMEQKARGRL